MLRITLHGDRREDALTYHLLFSAIAQFNRGARRTWEAQDRERIVFAKIAHVGTPDPRVELADLPIDAVTPLVLPAGDHEITFEERERALLLEALEQAAWPAHLSAARIAARDCLQNAERA